MNIKKTGFIWGILSILVLGSIIFYFYLPDKIPMHWDYKGEISRYGGKGEIFIFPVIAIIIALAMQYLPKIDPKHSNYKLFENTYYYINLFILLFFAIIEALVIYTGFYPESLKVDMIMPFIVGALFALLGIAMPKLKNNYFMGIRTPWTLANDEVWRLTHNVGGKIWIAGGVCMMISAFFPASVKMTAFLIIVAVIVLIPFIYSYIKYRQINKQ